MIDSPIGIDVFAECRVMATINRTVMIGHGTQIIMAWIFASSRRQSHVITYVKLVDRKSYVILYLLACSHGCVEIEFKSAKKMRLSYRIYRMNFQEAECKPFQVDSQHRRHF